MSGTTGCRACTAGKIFVLGDGYVECPKCFGTGWRYDLDLILEKVAEQFDFGSRLRAWRREQKLTLGDMALEFKVSVSMASGWENNCVIIPTWVIARVCAKEAGLEEYEAQKFARALDVTLGR